MSETILIIDDEPVQRRLLEAALTNGGYRVIASDSATGGIELLSTGEMPSAIILDLVMPEMDGMAFLEKMQRDQNTTPVIVQTAKGGIDVVVQAMRAGAFDFIVKPVSPDKLLRAVAKATKFKGAVQAPKRRSATATQPFTFKDIVSKDPAMTPVITISKKAADSRIPVLIEGESGTGKELIARAMHAASSRSGGKLVTVNCGALPENLVESLLFGHEKGAFTGATEKHVGKFEEANGGTLFLDEIGELPLDLQVKLLRAIQEGEIDPIGAKRPLKVDVRIVSATNRNLMAEVQAGRFREDLFYRLNVFPIQLPPLRARRADIEPLVYHFVKKISREQGKENISAVNPEVISALAAYDWPGNIRELENAIFRAVILCDGDELTASEFPQIKAQLPGFKIEAAPSSTPGSAKNEAIPHLSDAPSIETPEDPHLMPPEPVLNRAAPSVGAAMTAPATTYGMVSMIGADGQLKPAIVLEEELIRFALEVYQGRMSEVARRLGIGRSTLYRKLKEYGIADHSE